LYRRWKASSSGAAWPSSEANASERMNRIS
jgi:hypothetical protein